MARVAAFSNSFWGFDDSGVTALVGRMSDAKATNEELRHFFRERALIEEEYAKRLQKLAKVSLGEHESGTVKASIDVLKHEAAHSANQHTAAAQQLSQEVETFFSTMAASIRERRKQTQSSVERVFRLKLQQQAEVKRTKERYETDCVKVNGYLAQQNLLLGRELEKNNAKLEKVQSTLHISQADYNNATRALQETVSKWINEWRDACDKFQDLEEERLDAVKSGLWTYANIVSQVCVTDDESCEKLRVSLESCDTRADIQAFIEKKKTGNEIVHPPEIKSFQDGYDQPAQVAFSVAQFTRSDPAPRMSNGSSTNLLNGKQTREDSIRSGPKPLEARPVINQHPLDGITQLCRSDSNATYASESTGIAASSIYSPVVNGHTPSASVSTMDRAGGRQPSPQRRKSIVERMDSVLHGRENRIDSPPVLPMLKAQKTGSSIFDVLKPSRSRSRGNLRASASMPADASGNGSLVSHASSLTSTRASIQMPPSPASSDPIAQALENLKLRSRNSTGGDLAGSRSTQSFRQHARMPSSSEPTTPAASEVGMAHSQRHSLVAPPAAHIAEDMRQVQQTYTKRWSAGHQNLGLPTQRAKSPRPPGDLRRSPSPQPAPSGRVPSQRHSYAPGVYERADHARTASPDRQHSSSQAHSNAGSTNRHSVSQQDLADQAMQRGNDSRYDPTYGRNSMTEHSQVYQPLNRTRSKSFADLSSARPRYTPDGVEIIQFATALYDYQATIPEEIGFGQGDTLAIVEMREDGWWLGQVVGIRNARRGLVPSNFFTVNQGATHH